MNNAEWMIQNGYQFINLHAFDADNANLAYKIGLRMEDHTWKWIGEVNKVYNDKSTAVFTWLDMERKEPILDDVERKYLSAVIRPFRDRVVFVKKIYYTGGYEQIIMRVKSIATDTDIANIPFPFFEEGKMYKGMNPNREYTLEELGL